MAEVELISTIPVLNVVDIPGSLAFYKAQLGSYAGIEREPLTLHLDSNHHEFAAKPTCCRFHIRG